MTDHGKSDVSKLVKVKPMEWAEMADDPDGVVAGEYWIYHEGYGYQIYLGAVVLGEAHSSLYAAKAAAQADFERRILACITTRMENE